MKIKCLFLTSLLVMLFQSAFAAVSTENTPSDKYKKQIEELTEQISSKPDDVDLIRQRAIVYARSKQLDLAISDIESCISLSPVDSINALQEFWALKASFFYQLGNRKETVNCFKKAIEFNPYNMDAYSCFSAYYEKIGDFKSAIELYQSAIELDSKNVVAYAEIARIHYFFGNFKDGIKYAAKARSIDKYNYDACITSALCYFNMNKYREAIDDMLMAGCLQDGYEFFLYLSSYDKKYAVRQLQKAIKKGENSSVTASNTLAMGYLLHREGNEIDALKCAFMASKLGYNYYAECLKADIYLSTYKNDKAKVCADTIEKHGHTPYVDYLQARINFEDGNYTVASYYLSKLTGNREYDYWAYCYLGLCSEYEGKYDVALECYNKGIEKGPHYAFLYLRRGQLYKDVKFDLESANADFHKVLELEKNSEVKSCTPYAYVSLGMDKEARLSISEMLSISPDDASCLYDAACVYSRMGDLTSAVKYLEKSFENGYNHFLYVLVDSDIKNLRETDAFLNLRNKYMF